MKKLLSSIAVLLCLGAAASAQYKVQGVVVDELGPVIGATVMEAGTTNGTSTGLDGDYVLNVKNASATVEISCIGYATQTFKASEVPAVVKLSEDTHFLDEVVVIGYGSVKKTDMTGSVVSIKTDEINRGAVTSPEQMLMGKVAGLLVTPASGQPGAGAKIRIRGAASLNASNDPLIVIDGVPVTSDGGAGMGNPLASVNPNDIESYSVLKDASATAIYGSRASNGVIIITTKKGSGSGLKVNYSGSTSIKQNYQFFNVMNGQEFVDYITANYPGSVSLLGYNGVNYDTDWQKEIYRTALQTDHNVSVYGGGKAPFRLSAGYSLDQATVKVGDNQRYTMDMSVSPKFIDNHLSVNVNVKGIYNKTDWAANAIGSAIDFDPTKPTYFPEGSKISWTDKTSGEVKTVDMSNKIWNWYGASADPNTMAGVNPLSSLYEYNDINDTYRSIGNLQVDYKLFAVEGLRVNVNMGYDVARTAGYHYNTIGSRNAMAASPDVATQYANRNRNLLFEAYAAYNKEMGENNFDAMFGFSSQSNFVSYEYTDYLNKEPRWEDKDIYVDTIQDQKQYVLKSFFGRANYSIKGKYLFTATVREDGSSRFSPKNRWGLFPSAAFAWNLKNEDFLKGHSRISQMKLRLGWGRTGQQDLGGEYYPYLARYTFGTNPYMEYNMGDKRYSTLGPQAYNPNLKWETTETWNAGLDFALDGEKITGSVEAYYRNTYDLLNRVAAPLGTNFSNYVLANVGNIVNKGVEINLNYNLIETKDVHWSIGGNATFQDIKITKLLQAGDEDLYSVHTGASMGSNEGYSSVYKTGYAPYTFYMYEQMYLNGEPVYNGVIDREEDGKINESDRYLTGKSPNPWLFFGLNTHYSYKNWDFSMNGHGSVGNYAINKVRKGYSTSYWTLDQTAKGNIRNFNKDYLYPDWTGNMDTAQEYSDLWIENASFFKIDDINLGYTFNLDNKIAKSIRVAGSVQNVATFTGYSGLDPELTSSDGVDNNMFPRPRLYTLRVNINF